MHSFDTFSRHSPSSFGKFTLELRAVPDLANPFDERHRVNEQHAVRYSEDALPQFLQAAVSAEVLLKLGRNMVDVSVDFDDKREFRTVEVDNVAINLQLSPKFQPKRAAVPEQYPRDLLGNRVVLA